MNHQSDLIFKAESSQKLTIKLFYKVLWFNAYLKKYIFTVHTIKHSSINWLVNFAFTKCPLQTPGKWKPPNLVSWVWWQDWLGFDPCQTRCNSLPTPLPEIYLDDPSGSPTELCYHLSQPLNLPAKWNTKLIFQNKQNLPKILEWQLFLLLGNIEIRKYL